MRAVVAACVAGALAAGCDGATGGSDEGRPPAPGPDVVVAVVPSDPMVVPCDEVRVVRIQNRGDTDHEVATVTFTTDDALSLETELIVPRIVRAGAVWDLEVRVPAVAPGTVEARVEVVSDEGTVSTNLAFDVGYLAERTETFVVDLPKVDVLLVVDHSSTMGEDYGDPFARGVPRLLEALDGVADWQLILVTDDGGCRNGPVLSAADPDADWVIAHAFDNDPEQSELTESLLELASRALAQNAPTECNAPFLRAGSQLHVVAVSDEPEQSGQPWSYWVSDFEVYSDRVTVSAIVDAEGDCGQGANGYDDAAEATDGLVLDICAAFGGRMDELATVVPEVPPRFVLAEAAVPGSVVVTVDGEPVAATYADGVVTLAAAVAVGTEVEVAYGVPAVCEEPGT